MAKRKSDELRVSDDLAREQGKIVAKLHEALNEYLNDKFYDGRPGYVHDLTGKGSIAEKRPRIRRLMRRVTEFLDDDEEDHQRRVRGRVDPGGGSVSGEADEPSGASQRSAMGSPASMMIR